jgi:putative salt-induced outer membrane protein
MITSANLFITAAIASLVAGGAAAQGAFDIRDAPENALTDLEEAVADDFERDVDAFGNEGRELGFVGSVSMRGTATQGNSDSIEIGLGARFGFFDGLNGNDISLAYTYSEDEGVATEDSLLMGYDYTRELGSNVFAFAKAVYAADKFGPFEQDLFAAAGVGYRLINTRDMQWSVQAGPGYRVSDTAGGERIEEAALSVSSDYLTRFSDTLFLYNDTDVLASESDTYVTNEIGLNVSMTDTLALRTSLLTEYRSNPEPGFETTDNTLGVAVVYTFN